MSTSMRLDLRWRDAGRGLEQEVDALRQEIARLRSFVSRAAYDLKAAGEEHKSRRLLRALERL